MSSNAPCRPLVPVKCEAGRLVRMQQHVMSFEMGGVLENSKWQRLTTSVMKTPRGTARVTVSALRRAAVAAKCHPYGLGWQCDCKHGSGKEQEQ
ncbi:hypothetical protein E2562_020824 [Oryza meyeriana var. granulata]|uniref:Uncharacterized protein n=1 Tax=Oryza meyeriana var. granulata TaxID=110450 RepID=A0A6G1CG78_9ORYZ|nr:hypothetical protein E2562_020824 [Oryza meyeriana var. granulata]